MGVRVLIQEGVGKWESGGRVAGGTGGMTAGLVSGRFDHVT